MKNCAVERLVEAMVWTGGRGRAMKGVAAIREDGVANESAAGLWTDGDWKTSLPPEVMQRGPVTGRRLVSKELVGGGGRR